MGTNKLLEAISDIVHSKKSKQQKKRKKLKKLLVELQERRKSLEAKIEHETGAKRKELKREREIVRVKLRKGLKLLKSL